MVFSILFAFKSNLEMIVRVINILQVLVLRKKIVIHEIQYFVRKKRERKIYHNLFHPCVYLFHFSRH